MKISAFVKVVVIRFWAELITGSPGLWRIFFFLVVYTFLTSSKSSKSAIELGVYTLPFTITDLFLLWLA